MRGPSLVLSSGLPRVQRRTIASVANHSALRGLHLIGFDKFADSVFASILPSLPRLRILVLRWDEQSPMYGSLTWLQRLFQGRDEDCGSDWKCVPVLDYPQP